MLQKTYQTRNKPPEGGGRGLYQEMGLLYRFRGRKAFGHLGLCAERPETRSPKSGIRLRARGVITSPTRKRGYWTLPRCDTLFPRLRVGLVPSFAT